MMSGAVVPANERVLHFLWKEDHLARNELVTTDGEAISISYRGHYNLNAGPDFLEAKLRIGPVDWAGSVEVHTRASEWYRHGHHEDPAYDLTILHIVWDFDREIRRMDGSVIPTLELGGYLRATDLERFHGLILSQETVPCKNQLQGVPDIHWYNMTERCSLERLERKAEELRSMLRSFNGNWEYLAWVWISRHYGFKVNNDAFEQLARSVPPSLQLRLSREGQMIPLLLGIGGFLQVRSSDPYVQELKATFEFLDHKYQLERSPANRQWRFLRMRPGNFPTLRIAQLGSLFSRHHQLIPLLIDCNLHELIGVFKTEAPEFWKTHYHLGGISRPHNSHPGISSIHNLLINAVAPLLFAYGSSHDDPAICQKASDLLCDLPPEDNKMVRLWKSLGKKANCALDTQGMLHLHENYCEKKKCLDCKIGCNILRN